MRPEANWQSKFLSNYLILLFGENRDILHHYTARIVLLKKVVVICRSIVIRICVLLYLAAGNDVYITNNNAPRQE